jgi:poly(hydroxyalkanoate) depolymerase family esterase
LLDTRNITNLIKKALGSAGLDPTSPKVKSITDTIDAALARKGGAVIADAGVIEGTAREVDRPAGDEETGFPIRPGAFVKGSFTNAAGTRSYKVYLPKSYRRFGSGMPLVVMLHGCTQSPDEFAAASRMNELAEDHGFVVVYPSQVRAANAAKCWNWYAREHQIRDQGEPSLIAGITRAVAARVKIDRRRIFVAGHSAGAAMAVILGEAYPDLYAAIGVHSGLPFASAHDASSAFSAMHGRSKFGRIRVVGGAAIADVPARANLTQAVPTIVFHGDTDPTVNALNGAAVTEQALAVASEREGAASIRTRVEEGETAGRRYRRTVHADALDRPLIEEWVVHGAGHAWSGGGGTNKSVSDPHGPNAAEEMVRFFLAQPGNSRS